MAEGDYFLGEKYIASVLLYLGEKGEATTTKFRDISSYYQSVVNKAKELEKLGLVEIDRQTKPFPKKTFRLTEEGEEIAKDLKKIEERIEDLEG